MTDRAVIMARGLGRRMRRADTGAALDPDQERVADSGAKALVPVGRPFLDHLLTQVADAGFRRVCLVVGPDPDPVRGYCSELALERLAVEFAVQEEPRGTADAVAAAAGCVGDDPFVVINSDNHYPAEALSALRLLEGPGLVGFVREGLVAGGIPAERVSGYAVIEVDGSGFLEGIVEKPTPEKVATLSDPVRVSMNCWRFAAGFLDCCRAVAPSPRGELELPDAVREAVAAGIPFRVVTLSVPVLDLSSRADIAAVAARLRDAEVRL